MTWTTYHRRGEVLREVIATADSRRDGILPVDVAGVHRTFTDDADLLAALTLRWHTRLAGRLELAAVLPGPEGAQGPLDADGVVEAWRRTAADLPGIRAILDRAADMADVADIADHAGDHTGADAVARIAATSAAKEHLLLAHWAGLGVGDDLAAEHLGADLVARARMAAPHALPPVPTPPRIGLVERIRGALAA